MVGAGATNFLRNLRKSFEKEEIIAHIQVFN